MELSRKKKIIDFWGVCERIKEMGEKIGVMAIQEGWTDKCIYCDRVFEPGEIVYNCDDDDYYDLTCHDCINCSGCIFAEHYVCSPAEIKVVALADWEKIPAVSEFGVKEIEK
jgi:hypothetical protein